MLQKFKNILSVRNAAIIAVLSILYSILIIVLKAIGLVPHYVAFKLTSDTFDMVFGILLQILLILAVVLKLNQIGSRKLQVVLSVIFILLSVTSILAMFSSVICFIYRCDSGTIGDNLLHIINIVTAPFVSLSMLRLALELPPKIKPPTQQNL